MRPRRNRRKFLTRLEVRRRFQFNYLIRIFLLAFVLLTLACTTFYFTMYAEIHDKLSAIYPQSELGPMLHRANMILIRNFAFFLPVIWIIAIVQSLRISGPLYRIEKIFDEIGKGNFDINLRTRKKDEFKFLVHAINNMSIQLKEHREKDLKLMKQLSEDFDSYMQSKEEVNINPKLQEIMRQHKEGRNILITNNGGAVS